MAFPVRARLRLQRRRIRKARQQLKERTAQEGKQLWQRGGWYWTRVSAFIALGFIFALLIDNLHLWQKTRYNFYQVQQLLSPRKPYDTRTTVATINDDDYWGGELARRRPIKRTYLAKLVKSLDAADAAVIALDFDLSSPIPDGSLIEDAEYRKETEELLNTVKDVGSRRVVVLARTLNGDARSGYGTDSDVYNGFNFGSSKVSYGYIALNTDLRHLPPVEVRLRDGTTLPSFAAAIVQAANPAAIRNKELPALFGSYLKESQIDSAPASDILSGKAEALQKVTHRLVIVGAHWHQFAKDRGGFVDSHLTPAGTMSGVFLHANWVEALLDRRVSPALSDFSARTLELIAAVAVAIVLATKISPRRQLRITLFIGVIIVVMSYIAAQNLGIFFDFFIPVALVILHVIAERVLEWRKKTREFDRQERRAAARRHRNDKLALIERIPVVIEGTTQRER
ncbi:MAG TPA: CHASE2 domain-containing protein [Candidatus Angelobacter sp.]|nr:CHASE2 domain-containing protein [Candidatus Angelobacter sp.]